MGSFAYSRESMLAITGVFCTPQGTSPAQFTSPALESPYLLMGEGTLLSPDRSLQDVPQSRQSTLSGLSLQSLVAHRVPLKPYAAPVPRSQSLQDQPTRNLAAFPASHDPDPAAVPTPTATPSARGAVIRQNSDPTSEGPGPSPNPPSWVRPDNEAPPKVSITLKNKSIRVQSRGLVKWLNG